MGQPRHPYLVERLARRFAAWRDQASRYHRILSDLSDSITELGTSDDGTVTVRVPVADLRAIRAAAAEAPPEPAGSMPDPQTEP